MNLFREGLGVVNVYGEANNSDSDSGNSSLIQHLKLRLFRRLYWS